MADDAQVRLQRDVEAIAIPSGRLIQLSAGSPVRIMQRLGGNFTVNVEGNLARIDAADGDALGLIGVGASAPPPEPEYNPDAVVDAADVRRVLSTCYDPEIPVDIVELGLVYRCDILPRDEGGTRIEVDMTLTAPGCGMGDVLATDVRRKLQRIPGVAEVQINLVFDPPWDESRMSEVARLKLGLL